jgi:hypothetical protein
MGMEMIHHIETLAVHFILDVEPLAHTGKVEHAKNTTERITMETLAAKTQVDITFGAAAVAALAEQVAVDFTEKTAALALEAVRADRADRELIGHWGLARELALEAVRQEGGAVDTFSETALVNPHRDGLDQATQTGAVTI